MTDDKGHLPEEGFLSSDVSAMIARIRTEFASWFEVTRRLSDLGMRVLRAMKVPSDDNQRLTAALLYGRALTSFQSAYILAERGLAADARTLIRASVETAVVLNALLLNPKLTDVLIKRHQWHSRKLLSAWLNDPEAVTQMSADQQAAFKAEIARLDAVDSKLKKMKDPINIADLAVKTGMLPTYNAVYRLLSGDSAHTSIDAMERHVRTDAQAIIRGFRFGPETSDLADTLSVAILAFSPAMKSVIVVFDLSEFNAALDLCVTDWKVLGETSDQASGGDGG
jgi:Family of unknown function (DUF5677)